MSIVMWLASGYIQFIPLPKLTLLYHFYQPAVITAIVVEQRLFALCSGNHRDVSKSLTQPSATATVQPLPTTVDDVSSRHPLDVGDKVQQRSTRSEVTTCSRSREKRASTNTESLPEPHGLDGSASGFSDDAESCRQPEFCNQNEAKRAMREREELFDSFCQTAIDAAHNALVYLTGNRLKTTIVSPDASTNSHSQAAAATSNFVQDNETVDKLFDLRRNGIVPPPAETPVQNAHCTAPLLKINFGVNWRILSSTQACVVLQFMHSNGAVCHWNCFIYLFIHLTSCSLQLVHFRATSDNSLARSEQAMWICLSYCC